MLGPKGSSLKRLQTQTKTRMAILGRGSIKDKRREDDLLFSCHPDHDHLRQDLHVEITALAQPGEAYLRIAQAMAEVT